VTVARRKPGSANVTNTVAFDPGRWSITFAPDRYVSRAAGSFGAGIQSGTGTHAAFVPIPCNSSNSAASAGARP
jgi:hypothetical protein